MSIFCVTYVFGSKTRHHVLVSTSNKIYKSDFIYTESIINASQVSTFIFQITMGKNMGKIMIVIQCNRYISIKMKHLF